MIWQLDLHQEIVSRLPAATEVGVAGSAATPELLDGWSDLDLHLALPADLRLTDVVGSQPVWAFENVAAPGSQVLRVVLADGRRLDLVVRGPGRVIPPPPPDGNDIRFVACAAAVKLGRGDRLIGLHLVLDLLRRCLVQAMLLRDHHSGTNAHRFRDRPRPAGRPGARSGRSPADPDASTQRGGAGRSPARPVAT